MPWRVAGRFDAPSRSSPSRSRPTALPRDERRRRHDPRVRCSNRSRRNARGAGVGRQRNGRRLRRPTDRSDTTPPIPTTSGACTGCAGMRSIDLGQLKGRFYTPDLLAERSGAAIGCRCRRRRWRPGRRPDVTVATPSPRIDRSVTLYEPGRRPRSVHLSSTAARSRRSAGHESASRHGKS